MSSCFDVAKYILEKKKQMTAMKLQKLVYYSQAWSLVWDEKPLFGEPIEAWINGPVVPVLHEYHRGKYNICAADIARGDSENLNDEQKDTIDHVLEYYGDKNPQWLSDLTHLEDPWKKARKGLASNERGNNVITHFDMFDYYSSLRQEGDKSGQ